MTETPCPDARSVPLCNRLIRPVLVSYRKQARECVHDDAQTRRTTRRRRGEETKAGGRRRRGAGRWRGREGRGRREGRRGERREGRRGRGREGGGSGGRTARRHMTRTHKRHSGATTSPPRAHVPKSPSHGRSLTTFPGRIRPALIRDPDLSHSTPEAFPASPTLPQQSTSLGSTSAPTHALWLSPL